MANPFEDFSYEEKKLLVPDMGDDAQVARDNELARLQRLAYLLQQYNSAAENAGIGRWFGEGPYSIDNCPKHKAFFDAGFNYKQRTFMAGNRVGKSIAGAFESACHATGIYPDWWTGRRFDSPTHGWACGSTARSTRDTVQKELLGPIGAWGTGMIPKELIGKFWALAGVPQGVDIIQVKHISGGWSTIGFKNYEQPIEAFYGTARDWIWTDEEVPRAIYNELLLRTMTTGGLMYNTFTPLKGLTPQVVHFLENADYLAGAKQILALPTSEEGEDGEDSRLAGITSSKAVVQAGWDDAPWLSEEAKEEMLADTMPHLRDARRLGTPAQGSGNVYPIGLETILCDPFEIPSYYKRLYAMDVGWNRTAALWGALDPQTGVLYIYNEYYVGEQPPAVHAAGIRARGTWIPGVIDPAARGRGQSDGKQLIYDYRNLGLNVLPANNAVDTGLQALWDRMTAGTLKVFNNMPNFAKEFVLYRRDERGRIIKENDHLMDCMRYLQNNISRASSQDAQRRRASSNLQAPTKYDIY